MELNLIVMMLLVMDKVMVVNVFFDLILMMMKTELISIDYVSKHKMIKNVFVANDMELINYQLQVDDKVVEAMIVVIHIMEMILKFYDLVIVYLDKVRHLMVLDMMYHVKMTDQHFDYNVDNQQL